MLGDCPGLAPSRLRGFRYRGPKATCTRNANFRIIDQCGHVPQEEQPEATMLQIRQFLGTPLGQ
jgi:pimeloyl-ACP methyl ester carboxylesterase